MWLSRFRKTRRALCLLIIIPNDRHEREGYAVGLGSDAYLEGSFLRDTGHGLDPQEAYRLTCGRWEVRLGNINAWEGAKRCKLVIYCCE